MHENLNTAGISYLRGKKPQRPDKLTLTPIKTFILKKEKMKLRS